MSKTNESVLRQLAALQPMTLEQLQEKWRDLYGTEPPLYKKQFLTAKLAYRIQEILHGGLSETARNHLRQTAQTDPHTNLDLSKPAKKKSPESILPGTRFIRYWHDVRYEVIATENGFEYQGRPFRSLSAVAREITGTRWNGKVFFGLKGRKRGIEHARQS